MTPSHKISSLRSGVIEVKLRSCSSKNEQKSCNLQMLTKLEFLSNFKVFLRGLAGKDWSTKLTAISDFQNFGFEKKTFFKN